MNQQRNKAIIEAGQLQSMVVSVMISDRHVHKLCF